MFRAIWRVIKKVWRPTLIVLVAALVLAGVFNWQKQQSQIVGGFVAFVKSIKPQVSTTVAATQAWQPHLDAVGSFRAVNGADLALETAGIADTINFKSGDDVEGGALLLRLRTDDDEARLQSLQAVADLAQITLDRDQRQLKAQAVSQATVDADEANLKNDKAQVAAQKALMDKKTLRAPFAGRLGIRSIDLGQYLPAGQTIVTLQALDPIFLDFYLPEQSLDSVRSGQKISVKVDTFPGQTFVGEIAAINPKVDVPTRNVLIRASLRNPELKLLPGMYAKVQVDTGAPQNYVTLPQTAISFNPYGSTVYIVDDKGPVPNCQDKEKDKSGKCPENFVARQTFVSTGPTLGDLVAVLKGVNEGDTVVTAGQIKLHNGSAIIVNNDVQPTADANPTQTDK
jgi:membrane fusion protein (multidrug efflux system)